MVEENSPRVAYDCFAPAYDEFNAQNDYEIWLGEVLLPEMVRRGLRPSRHLVLDVGCGTGRAFKPLLERGWTITGCDVSGRMLAIAAQDHPSVELQRADATDLPTYGSGHSFDLVLALNDVINYLTEDGDLDMLFGGVKRNLAKGGLLCFDANTLSSFEANWIAGRKSPMSDRGWQWVGLNDDAVVGGTFEAELAGERIEPHRHRQRHWTQEKIELALKDSGLRCLAALGMTEDRSGISLEHFPDEDRHLKTIYIGRHDG
jgi:SAM-dependent methyltransferase